MKLTNADEEKMNVTVRVNEEAIKLCAMQYMLHIKILSPQSMRDEIKRNMEMSLKKYSDYKKG